MGTIKIYGLIDPDTKEVRYIGKTHRSLNTRLRGHLQNSKRNKKTHKQKWIRFLISQKKSPIIKLIKKVPKDEWEFWEIYYIWKYRGCGFKLTNGTDGGDGGPIRKDWSHTQIAKDKIGFGNLNKVVSKETREKIGNAHRDKEVSNEARINLANSLRGEKHWRSMGVIAYNKREELFFHSRGEAERELKLIGVDTNRKKISHCLKNKSLKTGGYYWKLP